jgi:hypothetical protein
LPSAHPPFLKEFAQQKTARIMSKGRTNRPESNTIGVPSPRQAIKLGRAECLVNTWLGLEIVRFRLGQGA